ncbi:hypothetical protein CPB83DRAFT_849468 [Crepidotus variabilis]|uniref:Uncharacterized protein n=1 Tax=Crepidotus variabilis TaxID=179855 RepID=A0A9P6JSQ5_9AGAR|nr:hypothetical protein CPB83DRAFT_849468 [Crepidotus variabilis]
MIRPPPLQLKLDNRYPYPLTTPSQPKAKSFVAQLYKANWKNAIIALAGLNGLRYAFSFYNSIGDAFVDEEEGANNLFMVSFALCAMYMLSFFIEIYGIIGVSVQRLGLIRVYLYLTLVTSLLLISAGVVKGIAYFSFADELVLECITLAIEGRGWQKSLFRGRPWPGSEVPYPEKLAQKQCSYAWVHHSWNHIAAIFLFNVIPAVVYYVLVYSYYRQTVDPSHGANLLDNTRLNTAGFTPAFRRQAPAAARGRSRNGYTQVQTNDRDQETAMTTARLQSVPSAGVVARTPRHRRAVQQPYAMRDTSSYAAPAAAPAPAPKAKRTFVSRGIKRNRCPPPLMQSPSPIGLNMTPGPPSYNRGPSRVYAAFAAPVVSNEYDKFV